MQWHWYPRPRWHPHRTLRRSRRTICVDCQECHHLHYVDCWHMHTPNKRCSIGGLSGVAVEHSRNSTLVLSMRGTRTMRVSAASLPLPVAPPNCIHCRHESLLWLDGSPSCTRGTDWTSGCQRLEIPIFSFSQAKSDIRKKQNKNTQRLRLITGPACHSLLSHNIQHIAIYAWSIWSHDMCHVCHRIISHYMSHDITGYFTIRLPTLQHGQEPIECQLLTQGECLTPAGCFTPMANMNPHKVQQQKQLRNTWATPCRCQALLRSLKLCVNCCQVWRFDHVWPIGRDADATVLRSLDVHHLPSRPQHREVRQDTASRQSSDLLQLVRSFQLLSSFGHEAIAMPWTWAAQCRQARKNNLINVTDYSFSRGVGGVIFYTCWICK